MARTTKALGPKILKKDESTEQNERILTTLGGAALVYFALRRPTLTRFLITLAGGTLIYKGATGQWPDFQALMSNDADGYTSGDPLEVMVSQTVSRPRNEVYQYWRKLENLPYFMQHLESVTQIDEKRSHWVAKIPGGMGTLQWDAQITKEKENSLLAWNSVPGATVENSGEVYFTENPDGQTLVQATIRYQPPAGQLGDAVAWLFNPAFKSILSNDLTRFAEVIEASEKAVGTW